MSYHTEERALEHTCPQTLSTHPGTCIGSMCMAWRWRVVTIDSETGKEVTSRQMTDILAESYRPIADPAGARKVREAAQARFTPAWGKVGYCGLAGKPE